MAEWIDVPAHRVLKLDDREFKAEFDELDENGMIIDPAYRHEGIVGPYLFRRKRDAKLFRIPRFHAHYQDCCTIVFLEEV